MWQCHKCGANVANISSSCKECGYTDAGGYATEDDKRMKCVQKKERKSIGMWIFVRFCILFIFLLIV